MDTVKSMAKGTTKMIYSQVSNTVDNELARETWAKTAEEISSGWVWRDVVSDTGVFIMAKPSVLDRSKGAKVG